MAITNRAARIGRDAVRRALRNKLLAAVLGAICPVAGSVHAATATAVEFYNTTLRHYFLTAYPEEAAGIDNGTAGPGWVRSGGQFTVYTDAAPGRVPVCRFYGTPGRGPNSHFYTANAEECETVKRDAGWTRQRHRPRLGQLRARRGRRRQGR